MGRRERNIRQVERYVTVLQPLLERATCGVVNLEELNRPESDPPMTPKALDLAMINRDATSKLEPIFKDMILSDVESEAYILWQVLAIAGARHGDPGLVRKWRAAETHYDRLFAMLFEKALSYVVDELEKKYPGVEISVTTKPRDEPLEGLVHQRNKDNNALIVWDTRNSYRKIDAEIKEIIQVENCSVTAAMGLYMDRLEREKKPPISASTIKRARAFVKEEAAIQRIMKEKNCSVETAIEVYENRLEWERRGA